MNFAGIDVGKFMLHLAIHGQSEVLEVPNTAAGRGRIIKRLRSASPVRVVVEPTASYHLAVAKDIAAADQLDVMLANPRATANFAKAIDQRGKSDTKDCKLLANFAATMTFQTWSPPAKEVETLRAFMRRRHQLVVARTQEKVRLAETKMTGASIDVLEDIEAHIGFLNQRISRLEKRGLDVTRQHPELTRWRAMLTSIPGIGDVLAMVVTAELIHLPKDLSLIHI